MLASKDFFEISSAELKNKAKQNSIQIRARPLNLIEASARWQKYLSRIQIAKISVWLRRYFSINFKFMRILKLASCFALLKVAGKNAKSQNDQHLKIVPPRKICKRQMTSTKQASQTTKAKVRSLIFWANSYLSITRSVAVALCGRFSSTHFFSNTLKARLFEAIFS